MKRKFTYAILLLELLMIALMGIGYQLYEIHRFKGKVCLVPLGEIDRSDVYIAEASIETFYGFDVDVLPERALPAQAWHAPRKRYKADDLLLYLKQIKPEGYNKIIGITTYDIATNTEEHANWGIMGLATVAGESGIVSTYRLRKHKVSSELFESRLTRVTLHEMGHTLGLKHCTSNTKYCLLNNAGGTVISVNDKVKLCDYCRKKINYVWQRKQP